MNCLQINFEYILTYQDHLKESQRQLSDRLERSERRSWSSAPGTSSQGNTLDRLVGRLVGWLDCFLIGSEDKTLDRKKRKEDRVGELIKELYTDDNSSEVLELANKENVVPEKKEPSNRLNHEKREKALEARLERLEQLVGEGWSSSTSEMVRREETVTREARETHQATYILK